MQPVHDYDYIIAGAGCAGLSLAVHMIESGKFKDKKILIIDKDPKQSNDRTWCFWEKEDGLFEPVVYQSWKLMQFYSHYWEGNLNISPYHYKMIRGIDFYQHCLQLIRGQSNFTLRFDNVDHVFSSEHTTGIIVKGKPLHCGYVFNSILFNQPVLHEKHYWLLQHFKGYTVETEDDYFRPEKATLMDFRTSQEHGTAFYYVLPFSPRHALVEYTFFSAGILNKEVYDQGLKNYLGNVLGIRDYKITETEFGVIPMTNFRFSPGQNKIINLGIAGGQTKGSSGYTFNFIQKHSRALVNQLIKTGHPLLHKTGGRFSFYDSLLLQILHRKALPGEKIFSELFSKNPPHRVLKFLDNETTPSEELGIIASLPAMPFLKAAINQLI